MDPIVERAIAAIRAVFGDTSVSPEVTLDRLETLRDEVQSSINALQETLGDSLED